MSWVFGPGGGTPGGADKDIQFNNNGEFSGSSLLTTDGSGSLSASTHVSASTYYGDGSNLTGVTASAVQVADGPEFSLQFRRDTPVTGEISGSANFVVSSDMSTFFITGSTILSGALSSSDIVPLADEQYDIGQEGLGYENAYINFLNGGVAFTVYNDEGATISRGDVVYIKGTSGGNPTVGLAACDEAAKMPAFGFVADGNIPQGSTGRVVTLGRLNNIDTTGFSEGDILYVQTGSGGTSGSVTNVRPTGSNNLLQNIGKVTDVDLSGQIRVGGAGRTNATPNLDKGHIFVGDESDCSIQDGTIFVSASANRVGINNTNPDHTLTVGGDISGSGNISGSGLYVHDAYVSSIPANRVLVSDTNGQITSHSPFTFASDVLSVPTITASVGISSSQVEVGSAYVGDVSANGVVVGFTNGQLVSHGNFTFASDVLSVPDISASANVSASAFYFGPGGRQVISDLGTDMSILATSTGMFISADGGDLILQNNVAINTVGVISSSQNISGSGLYAETLDVSSSANGSIHIGEGISYVQNGVDRLDIFENEFKFQNVNLYQGVSTENTSNFNIRDKQVFLVDTNSSVVTGTLPGVNSSDDYGVTFIIKDSGGNAGTNDIVIEPSGSQKIDGGSAAKIATNYGAMTVVAISSSTNGLGWAIVSAT